MMTVLISRCLAKVVIKRGPWSERGLNKLLLNIAREIMEISFFFSGSFGGRLGGMI